MQKLCLHVLKAAEPKIALLAHACHGKGVVAALHVVVRQNRAAHDGQIGIRADEVVREDLHEIQQLFKHGAVDLHGSVLG